MEKKFWQSKTMWFNALAVLVAVAAPFLASEGYTGELPDGGQEIVFLAIAGVNLVLRYFFTNQSLR